MLSTYYRYPVAASSFLLSRLRYNFPLALEDEVSRVAARRGLLQRGQALAVVPLVGETQNRNEKSTHVWASCWYTFGRW